MKPKSLAHLEVLSFQAPLMISGAAMAASTPADAAP